MPSTIRLPHPLAASGSHPRRFLHCSRWSWGARPSCGGSTERCSRAPGWRRGGALVRHRGGRHRQDRRCSTRWPRCAAGACGRAAWSAPRPSRRCRTPRSASCCGAVADQLDQLPAPQARGPGRGAGPARRRPAAERFAVGAATLAAAHPRGPRTRRSSCSLDDAHLLDQPSARGAGLRGAAAGRRPGRSWSPPSAHGRGRTVRRGRAAASCRSTGLDAAAVGSLHGRARPAGDAPRPRRARCTVTAGNPLAVTELVRRPDALARGWPSDDPIPLSGHARRRCSPSGPASLGAGRAARRARSTALAGGSAALGRRRVRVRWRLDDAALEPRPRRPALVDLDGDHVASAAPAGRVGGLLQPAAPSSAAGSTPPSPSALPPGRTDERAPGTSAAAAAGPDEGLAAALEEVAAAAAAAAGAPAVAAAGLRAGGRHHARRRSARRPAARRRRGGLGRPGDAAWAARLLRRGGARGRAARRPVARRGAGRQHRRPVAARSTSPGRSLLACGRRRPVRRTREAASRIVAEAVDARLQPGGCAAWRLRRGPRATVLLRRRRCPQAARGRCLMTTGIAAVLGGGSRRGRAAGRPDPAADAGAAPAARRRPPTARRRRRGRGVGAHRRCSTCAGRRRPTSSSREIDSRRAIVGRRARCPGCSSSSPGPTPRATAGCRARSAYAEVDRAGPRARAGHRARRCPWPGSPGSRPAPVPPTLRRARRRGPRARRPERRTSSPRCGPGSPSARRPWPRARRTRPLERFAPARRPARPHGGFDDVDVHPGPELAECLRAGRSARRGARPSSTTTPGGHGPRAVRGRSPGPPGRRRCSSSRAGIDDVVRRGRPPARPDAGPVRDRPARGCSHGQRLRRSRRGPMPASRCATRWRPSSGSGRVPWADRAAEELDATGATVRAARAPAPSTRSARASGRSSRW